MHKVFLQCFQFLLWACHADASEPFTASSHIESFKLNAGSLVIKLLHCAVIDAVVYLWLQMHIVVLA